MITFKQYLYEQDNEKLAAGALFFAKDTGKFGIALRSAKCDTPHTWGPVGGSAQDKESPVEAVIREVREEAGLKIVKGQLEPLDIFRKRGFQYHTFLCTVDRQADIDNEMDLNDENDDFVWFNLDKPPKPFHPGFQETMSKEAVKAKLGELKEYDKR